MYYNNGEKYIGKWKNGQFNGKGIYYLKVSLLGNERMEYKLGNTFVITAMVTDI
jgi:hypothetical protein